MAQPHRAPVQRTQELAPDRAPLRQNQGILPRLRRTRISQAMATFVQETWPPERMRVENT